MNTRGFTMRYRLYQSNMSEQDVRKAFEAKYDQPPEDVYFFGEWHAGPIPEQKPQPQEVEA